MVASPARTAERAMLPYGRISKTDATIRAATCQGFFGNNSGKSFQRKRNRHISKMRVDFPHSSVSWENRTTQRCQNRSPFAMETMRRSTFYDCGGGGSPGGAGCGPSSTTANCQGWSVC